jgi:predicted RND superfamily exporter protein
MVITLGPMLYGNIIAKKGGVLDDPLLDKTNPYLLMDKKVKGLESQGLRSGDAVSFIIRFDKGLTRGSLARIKEITDRVKATFPEYGVLSLSIAANYKDTGAALSSTPYISDALLTESARDSSWNMEQWKKAVARDPGVYGVLIGRNFDYGVVTLLLPNSYDEIGVFQRVTEFLENRKIPMWQWYLKCDINPAPLYADVMPAGWVVARGLMDAALISDNLKLTSIGMILVAIAFYLSFISIRQSLIAMAVVLICFIWTRGSLGLMQLMGFPFYERVYFLLVYTSVIVSGISFVERKLGAYNDARMQNPGKERGVVWKRAGAVNGMILVTAAISIFSFATLYQINIMGILEVGVFSALGIFYLVFLTLWFAPALHFLIGGETRTTATSSFERLGVAWNRALKGIVTRCVGFLDPDKGAEYTWGKRARQMTGLTIILTLIAIIAIGSDYFPTTKDGPKLLEVKTNSIEFVRKTIVDRADQYLNQPGRNGFDRFSFAILPKGDTKNGAMDDPLFLADVDRLKQSVKRLADVREVNSIVDTVSVVARESYKHDLPVTGQQAHDIMQTIEWDLGPLVKEQLWFPNGVVLFVSAATMDSAGDAAMYASILEIAGREFPQLQVLPFGKLAIYPQADDYICRGKPINVVTSQWIVVVICAVWIIFRNRKAVGTLRLYGWRTGFVMNMPFVFATAVIALVMIVLRVPLDQSTACISALAINAAVDFGLYLTGDYHTALLEGCAPRDALHYALADRGKTIVVDIVLNALCFAPLLASSFIPVARLGWVMIVMLLACGFGALVILPALLPWCVKGKVQEAVEPAVPGIATD